MKALSVLFLIISWLVLGLIVFIGRESLMVALLIFSSNAYLPRFLDKVYLVVAGLAWLVSWFVFEGYYNAGLKKHSLGTRFWLITGTELILLFFARILSLLYPVHGPVDQLAVGVLTATLALGLFLVFISRRRLASHRLAVSKGT